MCVIQRFKNRGYEQQQDFTVLMKVLLEEQENVIIIMSDEAHFHLSGRSINKIYIIGLVIILRLYTRNLSTHHGTVWYAIGIFSITGSYFLDDSNGPAVTVKVECYVHIEHFFMKMRRC